MLSSTAETYSIINSTINSFDLAFDNYIAGIRTVATTSYFFVLTHFADLLVVMFVMLMVLVLLKVYKHHRDMIPFLVCVVGAALSSELLKQLFQRARPSTAVYFEPTFSFPSSHAAVSLALYGFMAFLVFKYFKNKILASVLTMILVILSILVGFSRLYLGVHYLSDVVGGFLIALLWLVFSIKLSKTEDKDQNTLSDIKNFVSHGKY